MGRLFYMNNAKYIGEFKNNMFNGEGDLKEHNGVCYKGSFSDNLKNGYGIETWPDGTEFKG